MGLLLCSNLKLRQSSSVCNSALLRIYDVSGEQLHLVQLYTNSLPLHTQGLLCHRKFLLAYLRIELLATVYMVLRNLMTVTVC